MFVQCDTNIVHIRQSQQQPRAAGGNKAFQKSHWHSLPRGLGNTRQWLRYSCSDWTPRTNSLRCWGKEGYSRLQRCCDSYRCERQILICHQHKVLEAHRAPSGLVLPWGDNSGRKRNKKENRKACCRFPMLPSCRVAWLESGLSRTAGDGGTRVQMEKPSMCAMKLTDSSKE